MAGVVLKFDLSYKSPPPPLFPLNLGIKNSPYMRVCTVLRDANLYGFACIVTIFHLKFGDMVMSIYSTDFGELAEYI